MANNFIVTRKLAMNTRSVYVETTLGANNAIVMRGGTDSDDMMSFQRHELEAVIAMLQALKTELEQNQGGAKQ